MFPHPSGPAPRVLLVGDDAPTAAVLRHRLERDGAEVVGCFDAAHALATERPFDLVVLESGTDGFGVLRRLRADGDGGPAVVVLCWPESEGQVARALDMGADDVLVRPFSPVEAGARLRRLLRPRHAA